MLHYFKNQHGTIPILQTANMVIKRAYINPHLPSTKTKWQTAPAVSQQSTSSLHNQAPRTLCCQECDPKKLAVIHLLVNVRLTTQHIYKTLLS